MSVCLSLLSEALGLLQSLFRGSFGRAQKPWWGSDICTVENGKVFQSTNSYNGCYSVLPPKKSQKDEQIPQVEQQYLWQVVCPKYLLKIECQVAQWSTCQMGSFHLICVSLRIFQNQRFFFYLGLMLICFCTFVFLIAVIRYPKSHLKEERIALLLGLRNEVYHGRESVEWATLWR